MDSEPDTNFRRLPGLFRLWDLQFVIGGGDYRVHYAQMTEDGAPLFAVYLCEIFETGRRQ